MEAKEKKNIFRKETLDRISSPEQLTEYLRVTNPGIWAVLATVILLLAGILMWSAIGTLETTVDATVIVEAQTAQVIPSEARPLSAGMVVRAAGQEAVIEAADKDTYGRLIGSGRMDLPDGTYRGTVVIEKMRPIDFLITNNG